MFGVVFAVFILIACASQGMLDLVKQFGRKIGCMEAVQKFETDAFRLGFVSWVFFQLEPRMGMKCSPSRWADMLPLRLLEKGLCAQGEVRAYDLLRVFHSFLCILFLVRSTIIFISAWIKTKQELRNEKLGDKGATLERALVSQSESEV